MSLTKAMPHLAEKCSEQLAKAMKLAKVVEVAHAEAPAKSRTRKDLDYRRREFLYELAFLRMFIAWENLLEQTFIRFLCGYTSPHGSAVRHPGASFSPSLGYADHEVRNGRPFILWHSPDRVIKRSRKFFKTCPVETTLVSHTARLRHFAAVRHRIAHGQRNAREEFDTATMALAGRRYRGARPGAFLRDHTVDTSPRVRWLELLGEELQRLAVQIG